MSASLIGLFGSSAFRLSTAAVSMSLAGSCFNPCGHSETHQPTRQAQANSRPGKGSREHTDEGDSDLDR